MGLNRRVGKINEIPRIVLRLQDDSENGQSLIAVLRHRIALATTGIVSGKDDHIVASFLEGLGLVMCNQLGATNKMRWVDIGADEDRFHDVRHYRAPVVLAFGALKS